MINGDACLEMLELGKGHRMILFLDHAIDGYNFLKVYRKLASRGVISPRMMDKAIIIIHWP